MECELKARLGIALLCAALSAAAVIPFFLLSTPPSGTSPWELRLPFTDDLSMHINQMKSFYNGLAAGRLYPRWEEDTNRGFGAPTTSFYPPGIYYLTSALYLTTHEWIRAILGVQLLIMIASAIAIYFYARLHMSRGAAGTAMAAYIVLPYHLVDQYQRGALAELLSFVWMPLMLVFAERLLESAGKSMKPRATRENLPGCFGQWSDRIPSILLNMSGLAASYGAFIWSHPPTAYQFTLAFGIFVLVSAAMQKNWKSLLLIGGAMIIGLALSASYLYPAVREQNLIRHEIVSQNFPYDQSYLFNRPENDQEDPEFQDRIEAVWSFNTAGIILCVIGLLALQGNIKLPATRWMVSVVPWVCLGGFASFMMLPASAPLGRCIPKLDIGIFSWRMLSISTLVLSLLVGTVVQAALDARQKRRAARLVVLAMLAALLVIGAVVFTTLRVVLPVYGLDTIKTESIHLNDIVIPRTAPARIDDLPRVEKAHMSGGSGRVAVEQWQPEHRIIRVLSPKVEQLFVRTFNYPGWSATLDGRAAKITTGEKRGNIMLDMPVGSHLVILDYLDTPVRRAGKRINGIAFFFMTAMVLAGFIGRVHVPKLK
jgi:hypothetical protein